MTIHAKLIEFHKQFNGVAKSGLNPHFKSEYMTLDDVVHATTPILTDLDLYVTHSTRTDDNGTFLVTRLNADDGESLDSWFPLSLNGNPQATGSQITYGKRYNLCSLLNIAEADDDGEAAAAAAPEPATRESLAALQDYAEGHDDRMTFLSKRGGSLTEDQAQTIIEKWKAHD